MNSDMDFYCSRCERQFADPLFGVERGIERTHFYGDDRHPEVETLDSEGLVTFCSQACFNSGVDEFLKSQGIPRASPPPDIGPIEVCALCRGPVDCCEFHLAYTSSETTGFSTGAVRTIACDYLSVVCKSCSPALSFAEKIARNEAAEDLQLKTST